MINLVYVFLCFNSLNYIEPRYYSEHIKNELKGLSRSLVQIQPLDSIIIEVANDLYYGLYVYNNNKYILKVNNLDSMEVNPFDWENAHAKGFVFENMDSSNYFQVDDTVYYLSIPFGPGDFMLVQICKDNGVFKINKQRKQSISSEGKFVAIVKSKVIAVPIIRRSGAGKANYWKYSKRSKKLKLIKMADVPEILEDGNFLYPADNPNCVKKIILEYSK